MFFKKINKLSLASLASPRILIINKVNFIFLFFNEIKSKINLLAVFAALLVTLAWSCAGEHNISDRSNSSNHSSSELSPASGEAAGQSDALSLETACIARQAPQAQRETHHYTYDATRTTEKCYLTALPELPLAPSTQTSGDEPREDQNQNQNQDQVEKTSPPPPLPYAASYNASSGVLSISAPEIHKIDIDKITDSQLTYKVIYTLTATKDKVIFISKRCSKDDCTPCKKRCVIKTDEKFTRIRGSAFSISKDRINFHSVDILSKALEESLSNTTREFTHSTFTGQVRKYAGKKHKFKIEVSERSGDGETRPILVYTFTDDELHDYFKTVGSHNAPVGSPSTNPSEAVARVFAENLIPQLPARSEP